MFKLPPYKDADTGASDATMHDDRAYTLAMLGWYLSEKRLEHIRKNKKCEQSSNLIDLFTITKAKPVNKLFG